MGSAIRRTGLSFVIGAACGAIAFESVTVLAFAAQAYGPGSLWNHLILGFFAGGLLGPAVARPQIRPLRAAAVGATALGAVYVVYCLWLLGSEPMMLPPDPVIRWAVKSLALIAVAGAASGAAASWTRRAVATLVAGRASSVARPL
jgi:hypothetical protein